MKDLRNRIGSGPILVHSDLREAVSIGRSLGFAIRRDNLAESLIETLEHVLGVSRESMIFPAFNYDFATTRLFDVENDSIQVGAFPEILRRESYFRRTPVPFFSFLTRDAPNFMGTDEIDPFGNESLFAEIANNDGSIVFFGAAIDKMTFIHHIESSQPGGPIYRYSKVFDGHVLNVGKRKACTIRMHVRPQGLLMNYDWDKIWRHLFLSKAGTHHHSFRNVLLVNAREAMRFLLQRIDQDPLYLLDSGARTNFLSRKGSSGRFTLRDFESGDCNS